MMRKNLPGCSQLEILAIVKQLLSNFCEGNSSSFKDRYDEELTGMTPVIGDNHINQNIKCE